MAWWKKLVSRDSAKDEVDFYGEGLELLKAGRFHEALTSFRLALREAPDDAAVLQQIAITYTRIGMTDEALKTYRTALQKNASAVGAHYGMAFLKLRDGHKAEAVEHLRAFLADPPSDQEALEHVSHARKTLAELTGEPADHTPATSDSYGQPDLPSP